AISHIDEPPCGMDVDRARRLPRADVAGIGKRRLDKQGVRREEVIRLQFVDMQLILALDRDEHPRLLRMKIEVPRPKAEAVARCDRRLLRQHTIVEAEDLERAGILRLAIPGIVAARHEDGALVRWGRADLVREDTTVRLRGLTDQVAERAIRVDAVYGGRAWEVEGSQQISPDRIDAAMDRARRQRLRLAVRRQGAGAGIDTEGAGQMRVAGNLSGTTVTRDDIEVACRWMRPGVLDIGRQRDRATFAQ